MQLEQQLHIHHTEPIVAMVADDNTDRNEGEETDTVLTNSRSLIKLEVSVVDNVCFRTWISLKVV